MKALYAFREDTGFSLEFMGIVPADYSVAMFIEELDDQDKWPESHCALYIDLKTFSVSILDEDDTPQEVGGRVGLEDILQAAIDKFYAREAK